MKQQPLIIADRQFNSRLFLGTGKFASNREMQETVIASGTEMVTVALKRINPGKEELDPVTYLQDPKITILPNTSGARNAKEAVLAAQLGREALETDWVKLEVHPDPKYLLPDPIETLRATEELAKMGFIVLPYVQADPVLCKLLEEAGAATVMPLASPIGSNQGLKMETMLKIIIEQAAVPVVVDAGIGAPSHAARAMEMGADAVLVNTAIATAGDPISMGEAFSLAVQSGRMAYEAKLATGQQSASASSPLTSFL